MPTAPMSHDTTCDGVHLRPSSEVPSHTSRIQRASSASKRRPTRSVLSSPIVHHPLHEPLGADMTQTLHLGLRTGALTTQTPSHLLVQAPLHDLGLRAPVDGRHDGQSVHARVIAPKAPTRHLSPLRHGLETPREAPAQPRHAAPQMPLAARLTRYRQ